MKKAAEPAVGSCRYDAFISYSHAQGRVVAAALHTELERFAKPWYRPRVLRIFRDQTNLAASPRLWTTIERALAASDWLILMASPEAAASPWVGRELAWWRANKTTERILIALTAGELVWADDDFDWDRTDALPRELSRAFAEQPLWIDLRPLVPGLSVLAESAAKRSVRLGDLVAEFAAPIRHAEKDDLVGEHIRESLRTRRTVRGVIATLCALLLLAVMAGLVAFVQRNEAIRQRNVANARRVAAQADAVREQRPDLALLLAVQAHKIAPVAEARASLTETLAVSRFAGLLRGHREQVDGIAAAPGGRIVATASGDGTVMLWDTGDRMHPLRLATMAADSQPLAAVDFDRSGKLLAAGGIDSTLLWDISDHARPRLTARLGSSNAVRFSPTRNILAAGYALWDVADPARPVKLWSLPAELTVRDIDISEDGRTLAVAGRPGVTTLWDISRPRHPTQLARLPDRGDAVALSPDGRTLILAPESGPALLWNITNPARPTRLGILAGATISVVFDITFSHDGRIAATAEGDGTTVWDIHDPEHPVQSYRLRGHQHDVYAAEFTAPGQTLVTGGPDGVVMVWSATDSQNASELATIDYFDAVPDIVGFSRDDRILITSGSFAPTYLWDSTNRQRPIRLAALGVPQDNMLKVDISPDNRTLITSPSDHPPVVWDIADPTRPYKLTDLGDAVGRAGFVPDGRHVIQNGVDGTALWDLSRRDSPVRIGDVGPLGDSGGVAAQFSPDGQILAIAGPEATELWDVASVRKPVRLSTVFGAGRTVAFRPDNQVLASTGSGAVLSLWDISRPNRPIQRSSVPGENAGESVAFSPDGRTAVTGSSDGIATIWDVSDPANPLRLGTASGHAGSVYNLALSHDGRTLVTGSFDRTVKLWGMPTVIADLREPFTVACALAGPAISHEDWQRYLPGLPYQQVC